MRAAAVLVAGGALVAALAVGCGTTNGVAPATVASTGPLGTTLPPTTFPTTTPATTTSTLPPPAPVPLLAAHDGGIDLADGDRTTAWLTGRPVAFTAPDLQGGVVFQEPRPEVWPPRPVPIERLGAPGAEPEVVVAGDGTDLLVPLQVAWVEGRPQLLYETISVSAAQEDVHRLMLHDLASGVDRALGVIGAYESSGTFVHVAAGRVALAWEEYGEGGGCAGVVGLDALLAQDPEEWVATLCSGECCSLGPTPGCGIGIPCQAGSDVAGLRARLSPDGTRLAVVQAAMPGSLEVVVHDLAAGAALARTPVAGAGPWYLDFDGERVLVGVGEAAPTGAVIVGGNEVRDLPRASHYAFWADRPKLPILGGGGLAGEELGTEVDPALSAMEALLGPPTRDLLLQPPWPADVASDPDPCHTASGGYGCREYFRAASWDGAGLWVVFTDGPPARTDVVPHLAGWSYSGGSPELTTPEGVTVGTIVAELEAAYGGALRFGSEACGVADAHHFVLDGGLGGWLGGPPADPAARVTGLWAGAGSSC